MMTMNELIARAEAVLEGVTPGPWVVVYERGCTHLKMPDKGSVMCDETYYPWVPENLNDWKFFAASRQLVPDLIAALRAEKERAERAEALMDAANHARLAFAGFVSVQSAIDKLDAALGTMKGGAE